MTTNTGQTAVQPDIEEILERYPDAGRDALIPLLQEVQETLGYLSREAIARIGAHLKLPSSKIYGVATFYAHFSLTPKGNHILRLCDGTACHVKKSHDILVRLYERLGLSDEKRTTDDGLFTIELVSCLGACGLAPVISINGEFHAAMTQEKVEKLIKEYRQKGEKHVQSN